MELCTDIVSYVYTFLSGSNTLEYEDLPNGTSSDLNEVAGDFNDLVVEYEFI